MDSRPLDLLLTGAGLWSADGCPDGVDSIGVRDGRVVALGRASELEPLAGRPTRRIDAGGHTVTPGICDAHIHLLGWAHALSELDLRGCGSTGAALDRVRAHLGAHPGDGVVVGHGWNDDGWPAPPDRSIDAVTGDRPVLLHAHDHHSLWANGAALRAAGIEGSTRDPDGGRIERDAAGRPTGLLREHAVRLVAALERTAPREPAATVLNRAVRRLHAFGITAVQDFENAEAFRALRAMTLGDGARVRVLMHLTHHGLDAALATGLESGVGDDWFRVGHVKLFADGTLGSRTAALLAPYDGDTQAGMDLIPPDELRRLVAAAFGGGLSVAIHAIGDRAARASLDAFEAAGGGAVVPLPPRIEHVQLLDPADRPRFARLGVAASVQPVHCATDIDQAERLWHSRRDHAYPWQSLLEADALMAFGSDAPIESPDVGAALCAAVGRTRADDTPAGGWTAQERVTLDQALAAFTAGPARLAGAWPRLGRLTPGARADLVVWDRDLHAASAAGLRGALAQATILDGDVVHERETGAGMLDRDAVSVEGA
jgi:predicted amidohydrolase YtcJ